MQSQSIKKPPINPALTLWDIPRRRLSSARRGYGHRWRKERETFLSLNRFCLYCRRMGIETAAVLVDNARPHKYDAEKFWDRSVWVPCCRRCHDHCTCKFDGGGGNAIKPRDGYFVAPVAGEVIPLPEQQAGRGAK